MPVFSRPKSPGVGLARDEIQALRRRRHRAILRAALLLFRVGEYAFKGLAEPRAQQHALARYFF